MSAVETTPAELAVPCAAVLQAGTLCGAPCEPGHVRCAEHRERFVDARYARQALEAARARVILRLEERADDLAGGLIDLALDTATTEDGAFRVSTHSRVRALQTAFKLLGMDRLVVDVEETEEIGPRKAERDRRLIDLLERAGAGDRASRLREVLDVREAGE